MNTTSQATSSSGTETFPPRRHTKGQRRLDLLSTGTGASLDEMIVATGWQAHTVRAAISGLRKRGYAIMRHVEDTNTVWSIWEEGE